MVLIELLKNFHHQVDRRRKTDKMRDLEFLTWIKSKSFPVSLQIPASFKQIKTQWLMHPDLQSILQKIQYIKAKFKDHLLKEDDANEELDTVEDELNKLDQQRSKEQKRDLDAVFSNTKDTNMGTGTLIKEGMIYAYTYIALGISCFKKHLETWISKVDTYIY
ncbi:hypothetical protein ES319_A06G100200v1 [Gossypium barbadense]|uniref:Uncharacterized protein n=3 Tax=Gossypium TaxID=3633 RepID=A0A5J5VCF6_GOSBA|nr:hypothetical protein ES319_A06G100200v1 [Gossypium barbadense]TYH13028.1 hypothetical protein ES288_A06G112100v1 [Gossypium darwinii]TYH13029.1 hypothetical protein ES288_A06G112100v1 [Gossypium darwinii]TYI22529.1 hypothetical protein ES332_A06G110100v1 [Gossypium tomentosum]TYI22530.1 hypothetical protein ES332_A06G110100v1 [Gossypium tomentosum]